jgi:hypothetical protein
MVSHYKSFLCRVLARPLLDWRSAQVRQVPVLELNGATFLTATTGRREPTGGKGKEPMHLGGSRACERRLQGVSRLL